MNIKFLKDKPDKQLNAKVQACLNRGIPPADIKKYLSNTFDDIYPPETFDEELLRAAAKRLIGIIAENKRAFLIQDSDCDGMTSAALMINYLYAVFPAWTTNNLTYGMHTGKQHGINDFVEIITNDNNALVIVPDAGTNDIEAIKTLHEYGCETIILDHHLSDVGFSEYAITINSQYNYPNKQLSGVGVVYKFCQYLDKLLNKNIADNFLDLVSIGMMGDMQSMISLETKEMIFKGLQDKYIKNPLIYGLANKSEFALNKADYIPSECNNLKITPMGAAFFIIPLMNAICRSGTLEEKELVFSAMLTMKAFQEVPSTKRGHKTGEMERIVDQALRACTNIKNRQTRNEDAGMELLITKAEEMLNNKVLVFCLNDGEIDPNIAGLVANKMASKYQRPVCVTKKTPDGYMGSMRGYTATGIDSFKEVAESSSACSWTRGHENAAGICINNPYQFVEDMNSILKDISTDIVYYVDYIWDADEINGQAIMDLAELNDYLGTDFPRPYVYIKDCVIENYTIMKDVHLKINLPNCSIIMWSAPEELRMRLEEGQKIKINFVAKCNINNFNWEKNPQLIIEEWEECPQKQVINIMEAWNF